MPETQKRVFLRKISIGFLFISARFEGLRQLNEHSGNYLKMSVVTDFFIEFECDWRDKRNMQSMPITSSLLKISIYKYTIERFKNT